MQGKTVSSIDKNRNVIGREGSQIFHNVLLRPVDTGKSPSANKPRIKS